MTERKKTVSAAVLFLILGVFGVLKSADYSLGQLSEIGPGYFPMLISSLLIAVAMIMLLRK